MIATRDRAHLLPKAVAGALGQLDVELEVIVVDDGSIDGTAGVLERAVEPRVRFLRRESPQGVARARNAGVEVAGGDWIAFLDDDDLWSPGKLRSQLDAARAVHASFAYAAGIVVDEHGSLLRRVDPPDPRELRTQILRWNYIGGPSTMLVRADLFRALGGFDGRFSVMADWDLWIRLALAGRAARSTEPLVAYLRHSRNMQVTDVGRIPEEFALLESKHRAAREARNVDIDRLVFWRWVALAHLRAGRRLTAAQILLGGAFRHHSIANVFGAGGALLGESAVERIRGFLVGRTLTAPDWLASALTTASTEPSRDASS